MIKSKNRIIIIGDEEPSKKILVNRLNEEGLSGNCYLNGREALTSLYKRHEDILLLIIDIKEAINFIKRIKKITPDLPFIVTARAATRKDIITALELGACEYLEKPLQPREITKIINKIKLLAAENQQKVNLYHHFMEKKMVFKLNNDLDLVPVLVQELISEIRKFQVADLGGIQTALHETIINAIEHGNLELLSILKEKPNYLDLVTQRAAEPPYVDRQVTIAMNINRYFFSCQITDEGPGFDWHSLPDPRETENLAKPHGRGITLIANYFDKLDFNQKGNSITLTKKLN